MPAPTKDLLLVIYSEFRILNECVMSNWAPDIKFTILDKGYAVSRGGAAIYY